MGEKSGARVQASGVVQPAVAGLALLLLTLSAYGPALGAGFIWDDDYYVEGNQLLRSTDGLYRIWRDPSATPQYYPLVFTSFWVEYHLWGLAPSGYHLGNILLHGLNAVLLWRLLRRLAVPGAWLAAAVFALHPVHVESVAWITERKNTLSAFFYLAALAAYLRFCPPEAPAAPYRRWQWYFLALALFVAALLSKTVTCSLPAAVLVILWWKRGRLARRDIAALAPFFAVGIGLGLTTAWLEKHHVGAAGVDWALSPVARLLVAGRAPWFYAGKLVWPARLIFIYPKWRIDPSAAWQVAFPVAAASVVLALWAARRRIGRGPLAAVLLFGGTLAPALGFFDVYPFRYSYVADHFQYLASTALIALLTAAMTGAGRCLASGMRRTAAALILVVLAFLTWRQTLAYKDLQTLWQDTLTKDPDCWMAHLNLGQILQKRQDLPGAIHYYERGLQLHGLEPRGHYNLATVLTAAGRNDEAEENYRKALDQLPDFQEAYRGLGTALLVRGKLDEAARALGEAVRLDQEDAVAWANLEAAYAEAKHFEQAAAAARQAAALAEARGQANLARQIRARLANYEAAGRASQLGP